MRHLPPGPMMPRPRASLLTLVPVLLLAGCDGSTGTTVEETGTTVEQALTVDGSEREYRVYAPPGIERGGANPVLVVFHGALQSAAGIELMTWLYPEADARNVIVVYPEAGRDRWLVPVEGQLLRDNPDVLFVDAILDALDADLGIDRSRVWGTGFSNGALMVQTWACARPDLVAAIVPVGGSMPISLTTACPRDVPVPAAFILGDRDPQFPWDEGIAAFFRQLGGEGTAAWWAEANGCAETFDEVTLDEADDGLEVVRRDYQDCEGAARFDRIVRGGHAWPGSPWKSDFLLPKSWDLDGAEAVFDFVTRFSTGGGR